MNSRNLQVFLTLTRRLHLSVNFNQRKNYYETLGVPRTASTKEIKKAYYQLAKKYHPDINKGDPNCAKKFQEATEAYEVLSDDTQRREFDAWGQTTEQMKRNAGTGPPPPRGFRDSNSTDSHGWSFDSFNQTIDPEELFRKIFGEAGLHEDGRRKKGKGKGKRSNSYYGSFEEDLEEMEEDYAHTHDGFAQAQELVMNLTFKEAAAGCNKEVPMNVKEKCPKCRGTKCELGTKPMKCLDCNGTGIETIVQGPFIMRSTCRQCLGEKEINRHPCSECQGKGNVIARRRIAVPVPPGIFDDQRVRLAVGNGSEIYITFRVKSSDRFQREGDDIHSTAEISLSQAILGGRTRTEGIYGDVDVEIKPGTPSHTKVRVIGKGIRRVNGAGNGDHHVHLKIKIPSKLTSKQESLLRSYAETEADTPGTVTGVQQSTTTKAGADEAPLKGAKKSQS
jgi:DnaJ family protein A protein 3